MTDNTRFYPLDAARAIEGASTAPVTETAAGMTDLNPGALLPVVVGTVGQAIPALVDLKARIVVPAAAGRPR